MGEISSDSRYAPIILFCYKRLASVARVIDSIKGNELAKESDLFIFSDGPKNEIEETTILQIRKYLKTISGFKEICIVESKDNKGLADSVISGVSKVIADYGKAIVLEDDLVLASNFLAFMNAALDKYESNLMVYSISGFIFDMKHRSNYPFDVFFARRHCSWGWATWKDRWEEIDWSVGNYNHFKNSKSLIRDFNKVGSDLSSMLARQKAGKIDSWAIRCVFHQFMTGTFTLYPIKSKIVNMGFGKEATNTNIRFHRYKGTLDDSGRNEFVFPDHVFEDSQLLREFVGRDSRFIRLYYYILNRIFFKRVT